ncbi:GreA/GreB family elongation factor [Natranaerobius thermophilus]|uniref:Transcription elongation factor GreA/GreB C-terminal domain-containing protein n=1 Tax=Natranaerobius thermophilus (strain ATCC BAA-1301 / DSM 18059 / JW/NM-WN-LF) TaxID=457570 RepID=B2A7T5_NATTJ|nr:GreA/GreB family elongation factor [Natranaerobius thermophilus]ACB84387.1 hypothetical protein Nther_0801 [Natranaerobius thermophilus JW/NM-WN-LF]
MLIEMENSNKEKEKGSDNLDFELVLLRLHIKNKKNIKEKFLTLKQLEILDEIIEEFIWLDILKSDLRDGLFSIDELLEIKEFIKSMIKTYSNQFITIEDQVTIKDLLDDNIFQFKLTENNKDTEIKTISPKSPVGQKLIGKTYGEIIEVEVSTIGKKELNKYKVLDYVKSSYVEEIKFNIIQEEFFYIEDWPKDEFDVSSFGINNNCYEKMEETPLYKCGYKIWENGRELSENERWDRLINNAIPKLGTKEVVGTIMSHIRSRSISGEEKYKNAINKWKLDLSKLQNEFNKKKIDLFKSKKSI